MKSIQCNSKLWSLLLVLGILVSLGGCSCNNLPADDGPKKDDSQKDKAIDPNHEKTVAEVVDAIQKKFSDEISEKNAQFLKQNFKGKKINEGLDQEIMVGKAKFVKGSTVMHLLVISGNTELVKLFTKEGASWTTQDAEGNTPLHKAVDENSAYQMQPQRNRYQDTKNLLEDLGKDDLKRLLKIPNNQGNTPLHTVACAPLMTTSTLFELLIERQAIDREALTLQGEDDNTVLHMLVKKGLHGAEEIYQILNSAGLDADGIKKLVHEVKNKKGKTPYDLTFIKDHINRSLIKDMFTSGELTKN